jgi:hypothetical protein
VIGYEDKNEFLEKYSAKHGVSFLCEKDKKAYEKEQREQDRLKRNYATESRRADYVINDHLRIEFEKEKEIARRQRLLTIPTKEEVEELREEHPHAALNMRELTAYSQGDIRKTEATYKHNERADELDAMSMKIALRLRSLGVDVFAKKTENTIIRMDTYTEEIEVLANTYTNNNFIPKVLVAKRNDALKSIELMTQTKYNPKSLHYYVITFGKRLTLDELVANFHKIKARLRKWRMLLPKWAMEDLFTSWEYTYCQETQTFHLHANVLVYYRRFGKFVAGRNSSQMYSEMQKCVKGRVENNGVIRDVRECVKYVIKGNDVLAMPDDVLLGLYRFVKGRQFISFGKYLTKIRQRLKEKKLALHYDKGEVIRRNIESHHNARPEQLEIQKSEEQKKADKQRVKPPVKNMILNLCPPTFGRSFIKTGSITIMNYDPYDEDSKHKLADIRMYCEEARRIGFANAMPLPSEVLKIDRMIAERVEPSKVDAEIQRCKEDAEDRLYDALLEKYSAIQDELDGVADGVHKETLIVPNEDNVIIDLLDSPPPKEEKGEASPPPKSILQSIFTDIVLTSPNNDMPI